MSHDPFWLIREKQMSHDLILIDLWKTNDPWSNFSLVDLK